MLDNSAIARFPSNGLVALDETLKTQRSKAVALARGRAMGTIFCIENPEAAAKIVYEVYPQSRPTGKDEATAAATDAAVMSSTDYSEDVRTLGIKDWGESNLADYADYLSFMHRWNITKEDVPVEDFVTNELIVDINKFDPAAIIKTAKEYKD
jgi:NitT/TauT family transport system substrate-binding protein